MKSSHSRENQVKRVELLELLNALNINVDPQLFDLALTHRSYAYEHGQSPHNERLEFLGDSVLGVVVTDYLYRNFPSYPEGRLAKLRAAVVSSVALGKIGRKLQIGQLIKLGRGEKTTGGADKTSILADTMEAIIGAIYLSTDKDTIERFVLHVFTPSITQANAVGEGLDPKTAIQEIAAASGHEVEYDISDTGPDHAKIFTAWVIIGDERFGPGVAGSKKHAEQIAARLAFEHLHSDSRNTDEADGNISVTNEHSNEKL